MLVQAMTEEEILREIRNDRSNCLNYIEKIINKYRRQALKSSNFPMKFPPIEYTTKNRNKCLIYFKAFCKKDANGLYFTIVFPFLKADGIYGIMILPDDRKMGITIYTPHFFKRYKERFLKSDISIYQTMKEFFLNNSVAISRLVSENNMQSTVTDGIVFHNIISEYIYIAKTFVSREMLFTNQIVEDEKMLHKLNIVEEMKRKNKFHLIKKIAA